MLRYMNPNTLGLLSSFYSSQGSLNLLDRKLNESEFIEFVQSALFKQGNLNQLDQRSSIRSS